MPDNGRENAVALSINDRFFITTGRQFGGTLTEECDLGYS